ncbi:hypothetical protein [Alistipes sp.]|uniref:hypothetical protein n=1 Tax=Alistipes sp. TaxID=1872444 RepID=UPI0039955AD5
MPWKPPYRPRNDGAVTQSYNDGVVTVYCETDAAKSGFKPQPSLKPKLTLRYEERRLGLQRYYEGRQNQAQLERVLRVPRAGSVSSQDVAITEDGKQYRIDLVQAVTDVYPPSMDLTLARIEQKYEVSHDVV